MNKGKSKVLVDDIPVKKHVRRNNEMVIEENVNPVAMDTDTGSDSEKGEDELIDLRKRKTEAKKTPMKSNRQTFPVNEDDLIRKLRDEGDGITDPFKIVESKVEKYPIHDVETHWRMRKPKVGEKIMDVDQLKECLTYYAFANGYSLWFYRSEKTKLIAKCGSRPEMLKEPDKGLKEGWKLGRRTVIALDGCFLKKPNVGEILTAIGRDGNNHIFLVAWAIVNAENKDNWSWFLDLLGDDLDMPTRKGLTLISDPHKGLIQAVKDVMPHAKHRQCARHIYEGFRKQFSCVKFRSLFWAASKASYPGLFNKIMDKIKRANPKAYQYLLVKDPKTWSKAYFRIGMNCEAVENGFSECFNSVLLRVRNKPLITMLEAMRVIVLERMNTMRKLLESWSEDICPNIQKRLEVTKDHHRFWHGIPTGGNLFEVSNGYEAFRVDEEHRTCSYRLCGNTFLLAVAFFFRQWKVPSGSGNFLTSSGNVLCILFPTILP
uniref:Pentatricopeptide repeat-containing protein n=1 Tax=Tanacetum cinerariifolium TaxID=118510 RepID=A0A699HEW8_TANCI|nr:pentatricopeptide repeat-containing protein [Tanacetum cinerariifolium]